jgi:hypothetical protein
LKTRELRLGRWLLLAALVVFAVAEPRLVDGPLRLSAFLFLCGALVFQGLGLDSKWESGPWIFRGLIAVALILLTVAILSGR